MEKKNKIKKRSVLILGSSRSMGDTYRTVKYISDQTGIDIIDLKTKNIGAFDYEFKNRDDDFLPTMKHIIAHYDTLIFATPVYWYTMSGIMKNFFDRITDFLQNDKATGRLIRGKNLAMISCSNSDDLHPTFSLPFEESAHYLGMNYLGSMHAWIIDEKMPEEVKIKIDSFIEKLSL